MKQTVSVQELRAALERTRWWEPTEQTVERLKEIARLAIDQLERVEDEREAKQQADHHARVSGGRKDAL